MVVDIACQAVDHNILVAVHIAGMGFRTDHNLAVVHTVLESHVDLIHKALLGLHRNVVAQVVVTWDSSVVDPRASCTYFDRP